MRTQVVIIGGGPSGLLLGQLLLRQGIDTVILERKTRDFVLGRIRAGVLEVGLVKLMQEAGVSARMEAEGIPHDGTQIAYDGQIFRVDFSGHTGAPVIVYGQTELTRDLYDARAGSNGQTVFNAQNVQIHDTDSTAPYVSYQQNGQDRRLDCDYIAGCDGFHGVSRQTIPARLRTEYKKSYPFGWLGILSRTPPVSHELIYANSERGFALCSMRRENLSRYYLQCPLSDSVDDWPDARFWDELKRRIPPETADAIITGPSIEKSIVLLRSFVTEPMRWGRLFLCGDAAHIMPPTGAKGLNTAASDVQYLYHGLLEHYQNGNDSRLDNYSARALARVWKAERFSWWMTNLLHRFPDQSTFDLKMQRADLDFLRENDAAQMVLAQNYVGLPY